MFRKPKPTVKATAIIVAAGNSRRMGADVDKQLVLIDGMPVLAHTLLKFSKAEAIESIIIVTKPSSILTIKDMVQEFSISKVKQIVPGGETRQDSVNCGLKFVENDSLVAIHDGARPFVSVELINSLVKAASEYGAAAPGIVPKDTVKRSSATEFISETIDRQTLRLIQTPQVFFADEIKLAYIRAVESGFEGTDDCSVAENMGVSIKIIEGENTNIKVTTPEDLPIAEAIYSYFEKK